jgi:hypothetical protein
MGLVLLLVAVAAKSTAAEPGQRGEYTRRGSSGGDARLGEDHAAAAMELRLG